MVMCLLCPIGSQPKRLELKIMKARKIIKRTATVFYKDIKKDTFYTNKETLWGSGPNVWYIFLPSKNYGTRIVKNRLIAVCLELDFLYVESAIPQSNLMFKEIRPDWAKLENVKITKRLLGL